MGTKIAQLGESRPEQPAPRIHRTVAPAMYEPPRIQAAFRMLNWLNEVMRYDRIDPSGTASFDYGRDLNKQEEAVRRLCYNAITKYVTGEEDYQNYILMGDQQIELPGCEVRPPATLANTHVLRAPPISTPQMMQSPDIGTVTDDEEDKE